jgi:hypothetical protein
MARSRSPRIALLLPPRPSFLAARAPARKINIAERPTGEGGSTFDAGGYLAVDERERRMEWGVAEAGRDYSGWLTVVDHGEGGSEVVARPSVTLLISA